MARAAHTGGLDLLGAERRRVVRPLSASSLAIAVGGGLIGCFAWRKHPVLGFMGGAALTANTHALIAGHRTWKDAATRVGQHVVATAGSLALPAHPAFGYVAAAVAADLLVDGKDGGIIEEWAHHAGADDSTIIDVEAEGEESANQPKALPKAA